MEGKTDSGLNMVSVLVWQMEKRLIVALYHVEDRLDSLDKKVICRW